MIGVLKITQEEKSYEDIDSWWDLVSECKVRVIELIENKYSFKIQAQHKDKLKEVLFPKEQLSNLCYFLEEQKQSKSNLPEIQCSEFCNLINWINDFSKYLKNKITFEEINTINIWESLLICNIWEEENNFKINNLSYIKKPFFHFAIYIWEWLYISKFWKWNIYVTTFKEMYKIYNYNNFYIITKKEN
jgi:hypothetical protein